MPLMTLFRAKSLRSGYLWRGRSPGWLVGAWLVATPTFAQTEAPSVPSATESPPVAVTDTPAPTSPETRDAAAQESASATPVSETARNQERVEFTTQQFGKNSLQTAEAYSDLAEAQRRAGQHEEAAESYVAAIDSYRAVDGPFTPLAIPPLTSLGDNYREAHDNVNAVTAYGEARTVGRRVYGLLNEDQIPLLDRLSETLLELNRPADAEAQQVEELRLIQRAYPPESDRALDAMYKYAAWLGERGLQQPERDQYDAAIRIITDHYGKDDPRLVKPLLAIGNSFRRQRLPDGKGLTSLQDALALLVAQPNRDPLAVATALLDLGDWQIAFNRGRYNGAEYKRAWQLLGDVDGGEQLRREWFTGPVFVLREPIELRALSEDPDAPRGVVVVHFDVNRLGETSDVTVTESDPPGLMDEAALRQVRRSLFRPQMLDGELVDGVGLGLRLTFQYSKDSPADEDNGQKKRSRRK
jgi:TonB family protein